MGIRRYDYAAQFGDDLDVVVEKIRFILKRGDYDRSEEARDFERAFAHYVDVAYARTVGCGTDALILTLRSLGIGPGDEVITQANTFYATAAAIVLAGATPVLVDVDEQTYSIDLAQVRGAITARTRALLPVHLYGKPAPMTELMSIAGRHALAVVEDAAQAHGASIAGKRVGSFGIAGCFSFHPSKNLASAGDAGCVVTSSEDLAEKIVAHRTHGQLVVHHHECLGINSKMDALQAVVLLSKLPKLDGWNRRRRAIAARYRQRLAGCGVGFQREGLDEEHVYHLFQIRTPRRDALLDFLQSRGIDAVVRYPVPIHLQPAFAKFGWRAGTYPVSEALANELLCLPLRPDMADAEVDEVCEAVADFCASVAA
jgi:dTDP-4-amino-4,6-dideoxygalactose transaminase